MLKAALFGFIAGSALLIGAILGLYLHIGRRTLATIMAFGAGVLICTLSFDLMEDAYRRGGFDSVTIGFLTGAVLFVFGDWLVDRHGGHYRKGTHSSRHLARHPEHGESSGMAIFIGALLDGIPESAIIGVGLLAEKNLGVTMLVAVFLSNLPEGVSGAYGMAETGRSKASIMYLWTATALVCALSSALGYRLLGNSPKDVIAFALAFAAGAILAMVTDTMIPEAFENEGKIAALATVAGFMVSFVVSRLAK